MKNYPVLGVFSMRSLVARLVTENTASIVGIIHSSG
ncbi:MAG: hypothetical protein JG777_3168 [Clostridia bacterium]|nr:hypothetical protein [Clostridia bacterium]